MNRLLSYLLLLIVLVGLQAGISYSHLMQWPGKLQLSAAEYIRVQNVLIQYKLGVGLLEIPSLLLFPIVVFMARRNQSGFRLSLLAGFLFLTLFGLWALFIEPINRSVSQWTPEQLPANWATYRLRWHEWHSMRLALFTLTLLTLGRAIIEVITESARSSNSSQHSVTT